MRNSYPVYYKWAYAKGKEKLIIPLAIRNKIPKQTKSLWRHLPEDLVDKIESDLYSRDDFAKFMKEDGFDQLQNIRLIKAMTRFHLLIINLLNKDQYHNLLASGKEQFVGLVETYKEYFDKKRILKWLKVPSAKYESWLIQSKYNCESSILSLCARQYSNQTTMDEYDIIDKALMDEEYSHWPKSAIHAKLQREHKLLLSRSTFYKYAKLIQPSSERKKGYRKKRKILMASRINEYWHLDISVFRTLDGQKNYIYALIDRYSRKILSWDIHDKIRSKYASEVLLEALGVEKPRALQIISDGGSENTGKHVRLVLQEYMTKYPADISHKIALKDIDYSNNMIERFFNTMKTGYLYLQNIENYDVLNLIVSRLIYEYNFVRPHYSHGLLTPHEVYIGTPQPNLKDHIYKAQQIRMHKNKNCSCKVCTC